MTIATTLGGTFKLANTALTVKRMGYGAMKLTGPEVWGPPKDETRLSRCCAKRSPPA